MVMVEGDAREAQTTECGQQAGLGWAGWGSGGRALDWRLD
jgi:hypothetical protein